MEEFQNKIKALFSERGSSMEEWAAPLSRVVIGSVLVIAAIRKKSLASMLMGVAGVFVVRRGAQDLWALFAEGGFPRSEP